MPPNTNHRIGKELDAIQDPDLRTRVREVLASLLRKMGGAKGKKKMGACLATGELMQAVGSSGCDEERIKSILDTSKRIRGSAKRTLQGAEA